MVGGIVNPTRTRSVIPSWKSVLFMRAGVFRWDETGRRFESQVAMSIRSVVLSEIEVVAQEQKKVLAPLHDDAPLLNLGLDSLCFAILVARLEEKLACDPFSASDDIEFPVTVGDLVRLYEHASV